MPKEYLWEPRRSRRRNKRADSEPEPQESFGVAEVPEPHGVLRPRSRFPDGWLGGSLALFSLILVAIGISALWARGPGSSPELVTMAAESTLIDEGVLMFPRGRVALVHHEGQILALSLRNPHLGHPILFCGSSRWFEDPAHGEKFDILGFYRAGPSPRGMDRYPVVVEGGSVKVNVGMRMDGPPRGAGQANDPAGPFCVDTGDATGH